MAIILLHSEVHRQYKNTTSETENSSESDQMVTRHCGGEFPRESGCSIPGELERGLLSGINKVGTVRGKSTKRT